MVSPTSAQTASRTHWPSWSQAPLACGSPKSPGRDRAVDRGDDLGQGDLLGRAGQDVAAAHAPLGADQAGALEGEQDLLEVGLGQAGALGDVPHRGRRLGAVEGQREQRPAGVVTPCRNPHRHGCYRPPRGWRGCAGRRVCLRERRQRRPRQRWRDPRTGGTAPGLPEPLLPGLGRAVPAPGRPDPARPAGRPGPATLPPWFPAPVAGATQIVLLVLDGLGCGAAAARRRRWPPCCRPAAGGSDHLGGPEHHGLRPDHAGDRAVPAEHGWSATGWPSTARS